MRQSFKCFIAFLGAMILTMTCAFAQVTTSSISGTVADNGGAVVGAPVVAVHDATGSKYYSVTDKNGSYRINSITPGGPYTVVVEMLGYRTVETKGVYAPLGETVAVDFSLEEESLALEAAVFTADLDDAGMSAGNSGAGTAVSQRTMQALPTTSRAMNDVLKLTPQSSTTSNGLAIGGGSPMDAAKAAAARVAKPHTPVGKMAGMFKVATKVAPIICVPTTSGTGSEVTMGAVISDHEEHHKYAIMDPFLVPKYAVLDPLLTVSMPPFVTATTGIDALTHAVESYVTWAYNNNASNRNAEEAVCKIFKYILRA